MEWIILGYIACMVLNFGIFNGDLHGDGRGWSTFRENSGILTLMVVVGPFSLIMSPILTNWYQYGLKWRTK